MSETMKPAGLGGVLVAGVPDFAAAGVFWVAEASGAGTTAPGIDPFGGPAADVPPVRYFSEISAYTVTTSLPHK